MNIERNINYFKSIENIGKFGGSILFSDTENSEILSIISELNNAKDSNEALKFLFNAAKSGQIVAKNEILFKCGEYIIQNVLKKSGSQYANNMKRISDLNLDIAPKQIAVIEKDTDLFIISKINGTKSGDLMPYRKARKNLSQEQLQKAYRDLQQLTKAGLVDNKNIASTNFWYVTPDDNRIVLPTWESLREILPNEGNAIVSKYYNMLFG